MISFTRMVVHNVEHHSDSGFVKSLDHILEFEMLLIIATGAILRVRREEVQRHVAPIVSFVRVALKDGHQLDNGDPKVLQIWDLFNQACVGAGSRWMNAGIGMARKSLDVKFVDDRVRFGPRWNISCPIKSNLLSGQHPQRRLFLHWGLASSPACDQTPAGRKLVSHTDREELFPDRSRGDQQRPALKPSNRNSGHRTFDRAGSCSARSALTYCG